MNETMNTILTRRSIRKFTDKPISEEILKDIANAAMHAPSALCKKTWQFTVISNREIINKLAKVIAKVIKREDYNMYNPVAIVIPSNERDNIFGRDDNACALQNIFLAAKSYGVGSVWLNQLTNICDELEIRTILNEVGIPDNHIVYGFAALGYADSTLSEPMYRQIGKVKFIK
ncbi:MAG: NAD(P)H nitroreductase [Clostridiales bacterium]|nr:NAD(P)H nitroreductase [Clostridiales bacterium]